MKFDDFAYDEADLETKVCQEWRVDKGSLRHFRKLATNMYKATRQGVPVYVKVTAESLRPEHDIEGATAYLRHLTERGAPISGLILREDGERYGYFDIPSASYFVTVIEEVPGEALTYNEDSPAIFRAWGEAMGEMHKAATDFDGSPYPYLTGDGEWLRTRDRLEDQSQDLRERIDELTKWRLGLPKPESTFPVTHGDMNAGNAVWDGTRIRLIDFEEPIYTWHAADMARPFRETHGMSDERRKECFDAFMEGYSAHFTPQFTAPHIYSNFVTIKNLEMYGWGLKEWEGETSFDGRDIHVALEELRAMIMQPLKLS